MSIAVRHAMERSTALRRIFTLSREGCLPVSEVEITYCILPLSRSWHNVRAFRPLPILYGVARSDHVAVQHGSGSAGGVDIEAKLLELVGDHRLSRCLSASRYGDEHAAVVVDACSPPRQVP